jgi:phosphoribosylglycinamide formyltransferase-1
MSDGLSKPTTKLSVVILISGTGSNMHRLALLAQAGELPIDIKAVISDRASAQGLVTAAQLGIPTATLSPKQFADRAHFDLALADLVGSYAPQLIVLAGFMRILSDGFITRFADRMINIHPSLLPKYRGLHTHQRAMDAGDNEHGASVHFVNQDLDAGAVIIQARVPVLIDDTADSLARRVLQQEHRIFPEAVKLIASGRLCSRNGIAWLDDKELREPIQVFSADPASMLKS